ncbi:MAG: NUDIX domain-containing protein [Ilumatobacteraceae bacterium]
MAASERPELVDVVDEHDVVVGTVPRSVMRADRLRHRCVYIAVMHPDGRLLVHQRSATKDVWPGWWDVAVGGVVTSGESYDSAARRELREEIGVDAEPEPLGGGAYDDDRISVIGRCYRVEHPGPFTFHDGEVVRAEWLGLDELRADPRPFLPDSLALVLPLLRVR